MKFPAFLTDRLKTDYIIRGLLVRIGVDVLLCNLGLFMGVLVTVGLKAFTWQAIAKSFFHQIFFEVWLANAPILTACCLLTFALNGLYRGTRNVPYMGRLVIVVRGVGTAFLFFLLWVYLTETFVPRSTMAAGWFFIFVLILSSRLISMAFYRQYHVILADAYDPRIEQIDIEGQYLMGHGGGASQAFARKSIADKIEDLVQIGSHCSIYSVSTIDGKKGAAILKKNCSIGSRSVMMPGVTIGDGAVIGSCALVTKDVPPNTMAKGIPARFSPIEEKKY